MNRKKIYICAPWRGSNKQEHIENMAQTAIYWRRLYDLGYHPIAPQLLYGWLLNDNDPEERRDGLDAGLEELKRCDAVWIFGERITEGMIGEINTAIGLRIPLRCIAEPEKELKEEPPASWHSTDGTGKNP